MTEFGPDTFEKLLRLCAAAAPDPWYAREFERTSGTPKEALEPFLEALRMSGLLRLTDWTREFGQGYAITPNGERILNNPGALQLMKSGQLPSIPREAPAPPTEVDELHRSRASALRDRLTGPARPSVTYLLILANLVIFVAGAIVATQRNLPFNEFAAGTDPPVLEVLHDTGAVNSVDIVREQWWRLISCCFVHIGLLHLAVNMYSLYIIGPLVERMWGHARYLVLYLLTGLVGSCAMVIVSQDPRSIGAGASGAIWGVMVSMAAWVMLNRKFLPQQLASAWLRQMFTVFMINVFISLMPGISAAAHFAGGGAGLLIALLFHYQQQGFAWLQAICLVGLALIPVLGLVSVLISRMLDPRWEDAEKYVVRNDLLVPTVNLEVHAVKAFNAASPLLTQTAVVRSADQVDRAVAALEEARAEAQETVNRLQAAGPFHGLAEKWKSARLESAVAWDRLCELTANCLKEGARCSPDEDRKIEEQLRLAEKLNRGWHRLLD